MKPLEAQVSIGIKASPYAVEWPKLDEWFAAVGDEPLYRAVWLPTTSPMPGSRAADPAGRR